MDILTAAEPVMRSAEREFLEDVLALVAPPGSLPDVLRRFPGPVARGVIDSTEIALLMAFRSAPRGRRAWPPTLFRLPFASAVTGTPIVEVTIGDCVVRFWLDTGASGSVLSDEAARRCGIEAIARSVLSRGGATAREFEVAPAVVPSLVIGGARLLNERVAVVPASALIIGDESIDGILGWPVLRERRIDLDFETSCVTIGPPRPPVARPNLFWLGYPLVVFAVAGEPAVFGLDTGAGSTRLSDAGLELTTGHRWTTGFAVGGVGGTRDIRSAMAEQLVLGTATGELIISYPKTAPGAFGALVPVDGRLGMDAMRAAGRAVIDYSAGELVLGPSIGSTCEPQEPH